MGPHYVGPLLHKAMKHVYLLFLSVLLHSLSAQEFHVISSSSGLNNSTVNAIEKDHNGIIWLGTRAGLYKYNEGVSKEVFKSSESFGSFGNIQSLLFTSDSILLIGLNHGGLISYDTESRTIIDDSRFANVNIEIPIVSIFEDSSGTIWLGSVGHGIKKLEVNATEWATIQSTDHVANITSCFDFAEQGDTLWFATSGDKLCYFRYSQNKVYNVENITHNLSSFRKSVDVFDSKVIFGIESLGALELTDTGSRLHEYPCRDAVYFNDEIWISTDGDGLVRYKENEYHHFSKNDFNTSLITDQYYSIFKDQSVLWLGTYNGGALAISAENPLIQKINIPTSQNLNAIHSAVSLHVSDSNVFVGFDGEGLYSLKQSQIVPFASNKEGSLSKVVTSVLLDSRLNELWVGTYFEGIYVYDLEGNLKRQFKPYTSSSYGLIHSGIWSLAQGVGDTIWIGTSEGLQIWNGEMFESLDSQQWVEKRVVVNDIVQDASSTWIARDNEVLHVKGSEVKSITFSATILDLHLYENSVIVSTEGAGIFVIDKNTDSYHSLNGSEITYSYATTSSKERIIAATNLGLCEISLLDSSSVVKQLATIQELGIGEFNRKALVAYNDGLIIGGTKGLYFYNIQAGVPLAPSNFIIDKVMIDNEWYALPKQSHGASSCPVLTIEKDQSTIQIDFELVSLFKKFDKSVQYILDGTVVKDNGESRSFSLTNLTPGKHDLVIQLVSEEGSVLRANEYVIFRRAKFYQYPAFQFLTIICFLVLASVVIVINLQKRRREMRIKLLETEKELLASKASESKALLDKRNTELEFQLIKTSNRVEILRDFKMKFTEILRLSSNSSNIESSLRDLQRTLDRELKNETYWDGLQDRYYRINDDFVAEFKVKYPQLSKGDLDFVLLLRKNLSSKEIAALLNVTLYAVRKRKYRIKKKLNLSEKEDLISVFK